MSLINQALRKAQRDRTPQRMADSESSGPLPMAAVKGDGMKPGLIIGLAVAVAVLLGLVVGLSMVLLKGSDAPPSVPEKLATKDHSSDSLPGGETATLEAVEPFAPSIKSSAESPPILERETTPRVVEDLRKAREATEAKAAAEAATAAAQAKAAEEAAARAAAEPNKDIINWLARAQISGVKLSETESKVILNGKSYSIGEHVNFPLGLKVLIIQEKRVLFVDDNGRKYMKQL